MALHELDRATRGAGTQSFTGTLERLTVRSELLADNPLGDPAERPLYVYVPAEASSGPGGGAVPTVYMLQGFAGRVQEWLAPAPPGQKRTIEQLDALFASGGAPPALVVFVDAWTAWGGSQFLNSSSTGRYLDYLCDEVVPFIDARYPALAGAEHRGLSGKSSGGYGALVAAMLRPGVFGAIASHAGDALFECCYQPLFPVAARQLRAMFDGSWAAFEERALAPGFDWRSCAPLFAGYGLACAYTPDPDRPGRALVPFDDLGRPVDAPWQRWRELDPVRMADGARAALAGLRAIHLTAGRSDEFFLDLGALALSAELSRLEIPHTLELFDGNHDGVDRLIAPTVGKLACDLA